MQPQRFDSAESPTTGGWYTYDFPARTGVRCGLAGCDARHSVVYVGKTNEPWRRHWEHIKDKPWIGLTSGYRIHEEVYGTDGDAKVAEERMIRAWQPLANDQHNRDNPHRLVFSKTRSPRVRVQRPARLPVAEVRRDGVSLGWLHSRPVVLVGLWLAIAVGLWLVTGDSSWKGSAAGAAGASGSFGIAWARMPRRRRRGKR